MFRFKNKTIVIVSQQDWGKMFISKHHYASELAKLGNTVYYLEGPSIDKSIPIGYIKIIKTEIEGVFVIRHRLFYPSSIKHKFYLMHTVLMKMHIGRILGKLNKEIDIVWSFDMSATIPLSAFPGNVLKILMPVDEHNNKHSIADGKNADVILSVTNEILDKYSVCNKPRLFVNHGVSNVFISEAIPAKANTAQNVALSGNFLRNDIDWGVLLSIMRTHPAIKFHFFGSYKQNDGNLTSHAQYIPVRELSEAINLPNTQFYGIVSSNTLAEMLRKMDVFLICYDISKDQSNGTNYHKILEYLGIGKVVVSNNVTTYSNTDLIEMPQERNNKNLLSVFNRVVNNLDYYNSVEIQDRRIAYASSHTYYGNIKRIEFFINHHCGNSLNI